MIRGILDGMVMQRGSDNTCDIIVGSDTRIRSVTTDDGQCGRVTETPGGYRITGILCGGPYQMRVDEEVFHDIYVGDVWILAGQSNMQGCGRSAGNVYNSNHGIRAFYMQGKWGVANHPLHEPGRSIYKVHTEVLGAGRHFSRCVIGPGLFFAQRMYELTGVPQGVICCAHGDTSLEQWSPGQCGLGAERSLYAAMIESFQAAGAHVRGIFWAQGCNDTKKEIYRKYTEKTTALFEQMREDMGMELPIVYMQLARCINDGKKGDISPATWNSVQEQQRLLAQRLTNVDMVPTVSYELSDSYHLSANAHRVLGKSAAESMFCLIYGKLYGCVASIKPESIECFPDDAMPMEISIINISFSNVKGMLSGGSRPLGFLVSDVPSYTGCNFIISSETCGSSVILTVAAGPEQLADMYLSYGIGFNPPCNIADTDMRSLPVFAPIKLGDVLRAPGGKKSFLHCNN